MRQPFIRGRKLTEMGAASPFDYFLEMPAPDQIMTWENKRQSAFSLREGESEDDVENRLSTLDENNAYQMLEEYEFTFPAAGAVPGEPWVCFSAPLDGKITIVRKWPDKYIFVYMPFDYSDWRISSSPSTPDFLRTHGNSWIFSEYNTDGSEAAITRFIKGLLVSWLISEDAEPIIIYQKDTATEVILWEHIEEVREIADIAGKNIRAWEIVERVYADHSDILFLPDSSVFLPVKEGNIAPLIRIDIIGAVIPNIKMGVVHIPLAEDYRPLLDRKWFYFDQNKVLEAMDFDPELTITPITPVTYMNAWYPLQNLDGNRIKMVEMGDLQLFNPPQAEVYNRRDLAVPNNVISDNYLDNLICNSSTANQWSYRYLDNSLNPGGIPYAPSPAVTGNQFSPEYKFLLEKHFKTIKSDQGTSTHNLLVQRFPLFIDLFRKHIHEVCEQENTLWHPPAGGPIQEHHRIGQGYVNRYRNVGLGLGPLNICDAAGNVVAPPNNGVALTNAQVQAILPAQFIQTWPWSAAFISFAVKQSAHLAGLNAHTNPTLDNFFEYASAHMTYVIRARNDRNASDLSAAYWLYDISDNDAYPLEIGDLLVKNRKVNGAWTTHTFAAFNGPHSHTDLITEIRSDRVLTCGGNVDNNVEKRAVFLDAAGHVDAARGYLLGANINNSPANVGPNASSSQSKYFAIMKLRNIFIPTVV